MNFKSFSLRSSCAGILLALSAVMIFAPVSAQSCRPSTGSPGPTVITNTYDSLGRLTNQTQANTGTTLNLSIDPAGNITNKTLACQAPELPSWATVLMLSALLALGCYKLRGRHNS